MILWKNHVSKDFVNGYKIRNAGVGKGGHLQENLEVLIAYCKKDGREWSIAKIECSEKDVEPDEEIGPGWYKAYRSIVSKEGFMPLEKAIEKYLKK